MKFFVAIFVLSCAFAVYAQNKNPNCYYNYGQFNGGTSYPNGSYIPDSALTWVDIANNTIPCATDNGKQSLNTWMTSSRIYNDCRSGDCQNFNCAVKAINLANTCFCNLCREIEDNQGLADFFNSTCEYFGGLLAKQDYAAVDKYMIDARPKFISLICA